MINKGLGRGLGSLFSGLDDDEDVKKPTPAEKKVVKEVDAQKVSENPEEIDISLIDRNINQPRKIFNDDQLQELAQSIKNCGLI